MTQRFYVTSVGVYVGSYDGPDPVPEPFASSVEVPIGPEDASQTWTMPNGPWSDPPVPVYSLNVSSIWLRMDDTEAEAFDAAVSTTPPLRLRRAFNSAQTMQSDSELFGWVHNILVGLFDETRAGELMADEPLMASVTEEQDEFAV